MINNANMSNPISAIKPNFGMFTLGKGVNDIAKMRGGMSPISHDTVDRGQFQGDAGKELSMKALAKDFG